MLDYAIARYSKFINKLGGFIICSKPSTQEGIALGLTGCAHILASQEPGVVARPLTGRSPLLTTYLLRPEGEPSEMLARFIECLIRISNELY